MRRKSSEQSEYVWSCFIIGSFFLIPAVHSQSDLRTTSVFDSTPGLEQTTGSNDGKITSLHNVSSKNDTDFEYDSKGNFGSDNITDKTFNQIVPLGNDVYDDDDVTERSTESNNHFQTDYDENYDISNRVTSSHKMFICGQNGCVYSDNINGTIVHANIDNYNNTTNFVENDVKGGIFYIYHNRNGDGSNIVNGDGSNIVKDKEKAATHGDVINQTSTDTVLPTMSSRLLALMEVRSMLKRYSVLVIQPVFGILGLAGNILSGILARRNGFHKATNVFIFSLAVSDCLALLYCVNVVRIIRLLSDDQQCQYSFSAFPANAGFLCYFLTISTNLMFVVGNVASGYMCDVIAVERCLAVYFPLRFRRMITPRKAWIIVVCVFLFSSMYIACTAMAVEKYFTVYGLEWEVAVILPAKDSIADVLVVHFAPVFGKILPASLIIISSILIGIKIKVAHQKRKTMTRVLRQTNSESRTTKTLMMVCLVYSFTKYISLFFYPYPNIPPEELLTYSRIFMWISLIFESINSSCNFVIYVVFNDRFRLELVKMFCSNNKG